MSRRKGDRAAASTSGGYSNGYVETDPSARYGRFDDVLGRGAMKTVYRAFDEYNGREVAWNQAKIHDMMRTPDALHRMYSEVHLLSTLHHESIITFHGSWIDVGKSNFNFITELFTSGTLREYRLRYPRVHLKAIKTWARQILDGLVYLHSHDPPVIHRDIKCDNIFINGHLGQVKIGDLGLAVMLKGSQSAHSVIGTPEFMAPELYEEDYNELVDIYSFGMCMLEMLTSEFPYSECCNPAQIYKKVSSGKLPDAFNRIKDPEMKRFIKRCIVSASKRSSAKELLEDPFLSMDDDTVISPRPVSTSDTKPSPQRRGDHELTKKEEDDECEPELQPDNKDLVQKTEMSITGKLNPEDDTIFLRVQIADEHGNPKNIYFPFDIKSDTPIDVAQEMVKELEITDWEPSEIAEMIGQAILQLAPDWRPDCNSEPEEFSYGDGDGDGDDGNFTDPFYCASPSASSHSSFCGIDRSSSGKGLSFYGGWRDEQYTDDDDSSMHSGKYSAVIYSSGNEAEADSYPHLREVQAQSSSHKSIRFGGNPRDSYLPSELQKQLHISPDASSTRGVGTSRGRQPTVEKRRVMRNRSMVDIRSQLLHKTLVHELNKRLFKTVGSVENIGFQDPYQDMSSSRRSGSTSAHDQRKNGTQWF